MKKIKLNDNLEREISIDEYRLDPTEKYVINIEEEMERQVYVINYFRSNRVILIAFSLFCLCSIKQVFTRGGKV